MNLMDIKDITPDQVVFFEYQFFKLNLTIVVTWAIMALLVVGSVLATRRLSSGRRMSRRQNFLEIVVTGVRDQIEEIGRQRADKYIGFVGTLFVFIATCNLLAVVPGYESPTASLSTTSALAICVFISVPLYGIASRGLLEYLKQYFRPTVFMLPFNILGEISRTVALAVRLFGNIMSGSKISAILLVVIPFVFPVAMHLLGLLTGLIQAYIFAVLAMVYIASATRAQEEGRSESSKGDHGNGKGRSK